METEDAQAMTRSALDFLPKGSEPGEVPKCPTLLSKGGMEMVVRRYDIRLRSLDPRRSIRIADKEGYY